MTGVARSRRSGGFTLMEVLVAGVVLTMGVIFVLQGVSGAQGASGRIARRGRAAAMAADLLNRVSAGEVDVKFTGREMREGIDYAWRVREESLSPRLRRLICRVEWNQAGRDFWVEMERLTPTPAGGTTP